MSEALRCRRQRVLVRQACVAASIGVLMWKRSVYTDHLAETHKLLKLMVAATPSKPNIHEPPRATPSSLPDDESDGSYAPSEDLSGDTDGEGDRVALMHEFSYDVGVPRWHPAGLGLNGVAVPPHVKPPFAFAVMLE